jgi:hypothetical protein
VPSSGRVSARTTLLHTVTISCNMLGGASQTVSMIRVKCNGK